MKKYLEKLPQDIKDLVSVCGEVAQNSGIRAYLVGGFVRDLILGVKNFDLDIVVEGDGIKFAEDLSIKLNGHLTCHRRFGTATVSISKLKKVDIASSREECYPEPACLPSVKAGSVKDDLKRRDFTINAMAISINKDDFGSIIDYFCGREDLKTGNIRILHDLSFIDDPTRILRAVRFAERYSFRIEKNTLMQLKKANNLGMLFKIQPQRLRDELILMLKEECPIDQIKRLNALTGLSFISKDIKFNAGIIKLLQMAEKEIVWFKKSVHLRRHLDAWLIYLACLFSEVENSKIKKFFKLFVLRKGEERRILSFKNFKLADIAALSKSKIMASKVFRILNPLSYESIILIKAKFRNSNLQKNINNFFSVYQHERIHTTGADLKLLGVAPGPKYTKIFQKLLVARLDGKICSKEDETALVKKLI